jgi:hypothetical protein
MNLNKMLLAKVFLFCALGQFAFGQSTALVYQGRLSDGANPANGSYDTRFALFDAGTNGNQIGGTLTNPATAVSNGVFTVTLDFGAVPFDGSSRFLEIAARTNGGGAFSILSPRQQITPTPYALYSANGGTATNFSGALSGDVTGAQSATVVSLVGGLAAANVASGAGGANSATSTNIPGTIVKRDSSGNFSAGTIAATGFNGSGAGLTNIPGSAIPAGQVVKSIDGIKDGVGLLAGINISLSTNVGAGTLTIRGTPGGPANILSGVYPTVSGGNGNAATNDYATVGGGATNSAAGQNATIGGGTLNVINSGGLNAVVGGGYTNVVNANAGTIAGGELNTIQGNAGDSAIGGGHNNTISAIAAYSTIAGGEFNGIGTFSTANAIGGGYANNIYSSALYNTIAGGYNNYISNSASANFIGGGQNNAVPANATYSTIAGGLKNSVGASEGTTIGGGEYNIASGFGTIAGGVSNYNAGSFSGVGGGLNNYAEGNFTVIAGGNNNGTGFGDYSCVLGGEGNSASGYASTVAAGTNNFATGGFSAVSGGANNQAQGLYSVIPGGTGNVAANYSFAAGKGALAQHDHSFVWSDGSAVSFPTSGTNEFFVLATGRVEFFTSSNYSSGVFLAHGDGSWNTVSDRNAKENFEPVEAQSVLEKVAAMPMTTWNYKAQDKSIRHIGPMAQDFRAAFQVGIDDRHIATVDEEGVALAAIKGLNEKLEARSQKLAEENAELKEQLTALQAVVRQLVQEQQKK